MNGAQLEKATIAITEQVIEDLVYEHLFDLIDFDRMYQLEQIVAMKLADLDDPESDDLPDETIERAAAVMERAWHRLIKDERRYVDFRGTWQPDDDCALCRALAEADGAKPDDRLGGGLS
jgi:hypothetical protein